jgi:hypothetical protein
MPGVGGRDPRRPVGRRSCCVRTRASRAREPAGNDHFSAGPRARRAKPWGERCWRQRVPGVGRGAVGREVGRPQFAATAGSSDEKLVAGPRHGRSRRVRASGDERPRASIGGHSRRCRGRSGRCRGRSGRCRGRSGRCRSCLLPLPRAAAGDDEQGSGDQQPSSAAVLQVVPPRRHMSPLDHAERRVARVLRL